MLKTLTVINYLGESIELDLRSPEKSGLLIRSITGLGPAKADINITDLTTTDGGIYNSARMQSRNIVITLIYCFNPTVEDSRLISYHYFPIKKSLRLIFETDNRLAYIDGYVESNEPDIFSQQESAKISIICPDPYFRSLKEGDQGDSDFSSLIPEFESPFRYDSEVIVIEGWSNESLDSSLIEFGDIQALSEYTLEYLGDSETGITITIHAVGEVQNIAIYDVTTREWFKINTDKFPQDLGTTMIAGDDIIITTIKGKKSVVLIRNSVSYNILNSIDRDSVWFQLIRGENKFSYTTETGSMFVRFKIEYPIIYEGI